MTDWAHDLFPGDAFEIPTDEERDKADAWIATWSARWGEEPFKIERVHPVNEVYRNAGLPTNRAYMRSRLRRFWYANK